MNEDNKQSENKTNLNTNLPLLEMHRQGIAQLYYKLTGAIEEHEQRKAINQDPRRSMNYIRSTFKVYVMLLRATLDKEGIQVEEWIKTIDKGNETEIYDLHYQLTKVLDQLNILNIRGTEVIL